MVKGSVYLAGLNERELLSCMDSLGVAIEKVMIAAKEVPQNTERITLLVHNRFNEF